MRLDEISEVILFAREMDRMVRFYRDQLGLRVTFPDDRESYDGEYWVTFATGACTLALHGGGEGRTGPDSPKLVFASSDLPSDREALLRRGVPMGEIRSPVPGILVCDSVDPEGNRFSLESRS